MAKLCRCGKICEDTFGDDGHGPCEFRSGISTQRRNVSGDGWSHSRKIMLYKLGDPKVVAEMEAARAAIEEWQRKRESAKPGSKAGASNG